MVSIRSTRHSPRLVGLDVFRGWAIILMIVFHFAYDLALFHLVHFSVVHDPFWIYFRYVIVSMFLYGVGVSLGIVHRNGIRWNKVLWRAGILGAAAIVVTVVTRIQLPYGWVYFGILHMIWVASLVGIVFVRSPRTALVVAGLILYGSYAGWLLQGQHQLYQILRHPLHLPKYTEDLARFFPWFSAVLIGIGTYGMGWADRWLSWSIWSAATPFNTFLAFMGRHALVIYLIHLPVLYGLFLFFYHLVHP